MLIEQATTIDAAEILALQKLAYVSEAEIYDDFGIQPLTQTLDELVREFASHTVFKAVQKGRIVGSVRTQLDGGTCRVGKLIVHPEVQNLGIGSALMRHLENYHREADRFELFTGHKSLRNLRLYAKLGYREFKQMQVNEYLWLVYMEKLECFPKKGLVMTELKKQTVLKELRRIPGVGKRIAEDLWNLGFRSVEELRGQDPEELYARLCVLQGIQVDRCMLYEFRCIVYFASAGPHDPELLKWWNWKE